MIGVAIGDSRSLRYGRQRDSGATPTQKPGLYDPFAMPARSAPTYTDIDNISLPSSSSAAASLPAAVLQLPPLEPRGPSLFRDAQELAEFQAYTDYLTKVGMLAACAPVLAYAGAGALVGLAGFELAGAGVALEAASVLVPLSVGSYHVQQGLATGDDAQVFEGVLTGLSAGAFVGEGLGAGPRAGPRQLHHIATDKNIKGGFTAEFERIFGKAGMSLQNPANKMLLEGHAGRHPVAYHRYTLQRLQRATAGLSGDAYRTALEGELAAIRQDLLRNPDLLKGIIVP